MYRQPQTAATSTRQTAPTGVPAEPPAVLRQMQMLLGMTDADTARASSAPAQAVAPPPLATTTGSLPGFSPPPPSERERLTHALPEELVAALSDGALRPDALDILFTKMESARAALELYVPQAGPCRQAVERALGYMFALIDDYNRVVSAKPGNLSAISSLAYVSKNGTLSLANDPALLAPEQASARVDFTERRMQQVVEEAREIKQSTAARIAFLEEDNKSLSDQLEYLLLRIRRGPLNVPAKHSGNRPSFADESLFGPSTGPARGAPGGHGRGPPAPPQATTSPTHSSKPSPKPEAAPVDKASDGAAGKSGKTAGGTGAHGITALGGGYYPNSQAMAAGVVQNTHMEAVEFAAERQLLDTQRALDTEVEKTGRNTVEIADLEKKVDALMTLNGKYARQAIELAARVRVYSEHNDKFATLLSLQHDEKVATDKENELLRAELMDLNRFHQLKDHLEGEAGTMQQTVELRAVRHGFGIGPHVPRHIHFTGLMNRIMTNKDAALAVVSDIVAQRAASNAALAGNTHAALAMAKGLSRTTGPTGRRSVSSEGGLNQSQGQLDFPGFIHQYLLKKHGSDGVLWAYSLDDASRFFDGDCNLMLYGCVSRRTLSEFAYYDLSTDVQIFIEGCELMDSMQNNETTLVLAVPHIIGLLLELFPGYPESAHRRLIDSLAQCLTDTAQAHYRMLFPNLEREEMTSRGVDGTTFSNFEMRRENAFSATFKELAIDDMMMTVQQVEDAIMAQRDERIAAVQARARQNAAAGAASPGGAAGGVGAPSSQFLTAKKLEDVDGSSASEAASPLTRRASVASTGSAGIGASAGLAASVTTGGDRVTMADIAGAVNIVFTHSDVAQDVMLQIRHAIMEQVGNTTARIPTPGAAGAATGGMEISLLKATAVGILRSRCALRRGIYRTTKKEDLLSRQKALIARVLKGDVAEVIQEHIGVIEYRAILQSLQTRRRSGYADDEESSDGSYSDETDSDY